MLPAANGATIPPVDWPQPRPAFRVLVESPVDHAFVLDHTVEQRPPLVPEFLLRAASELTPLWEATEAAAARPQPPPFWAFPWVGGQALARFVLDHPSLVAKKRVLDFASGGGLVALAARRAGAAVVTAVDIDRMAIVAAAVNAQANELELDLVLGDVVGSNPNADVILTGDICYEGASAPRIAVWLRVLARDHELVLLGDGGRAFLPDRKLALQARYEVPTTREIESSERREAAVWRVVT